MKGSYGALGGPILEKSRFYWEFIPRHFASMAAVTPVQDLKMGKNIRLMTIDTVKNC